MAVLHAALLILAVGTMARELPTTCLPECPAKCTPGELVSDPRNCHQYFACLDDCTPTDTAFTCPDGYLFDTGTSQCQLNDGSVTIYCEECAPPCKYDCRSGTTVAANREDCTTYYFCGMSDPVLIDCQAETPYFDGTQCVADHNSCCDKCDVYCEKAFTETADPYSCKHYYYCPEVGFPLPENHFECPDGETFDMEELKCLPGAECYEPCSNVTYRHTDTHTYYSNE